jgi:hypothetical protein
MANDNLHRDIDKRAPTIEYIFGWIVFELLVDLIADVRLMATIHRPSRIQDVPFCVDDQFSRDTEDTSRNPTKKIKKYNMNKDFRMWCNCLI